MYWKALGDLSKNLDILNLSINDLLHDVIFFVVLRYYKIQSPLSNMQIRKLFETQTLKNVNYFLNILEMIKC